MSTNSVRLVLTTVITATPTGIAAFAAVLSTSESSTTPQAGVLPWMAITTTMSARRPFLAICQPARHAAHLLTAFLAISNFTYLQATPVSAVLPIATTAPLLLTANSA